MINHLRIAEAHLRGRPRQSAIALASVAVGAAMLIVTLSLTTGLSEDFLAKTTETSAHVEVLPRRAAGWRPEAFPQPGDTVYALSRHHLPDEKRAIRDLTGVLRAVRAVPEVRVASPSVEAQVVVAYGTVQRAAVLTGVVPALEAHVTALPSKVVAGSWGALEAASDGVIVGGELARSLGVGVGDHLQAVGPSGEARPLRVVAMVRSGLARIDTTLALVNIAWAQSMVGFSADEATTVRLALQDPLAAPEVASRVQQRTGYVARSWQERSAASVEAFDRQNRITLVLVLFTTLVAAFGVANVLVQLVSEKRRDIAILRAAGFSRHDIGVVFLHEGILLGVLGSVLGWALGAVLIRLVAAIPVDFGEAAVLRNEHLQMAEHLRFYLVALVVGIAVCGLAAVQPARRAARLEPTAILRGER